MSNSKLEALGWDDWFDPFDEAALTQHLAAHNIPTHGAATVNFGAEGEGLSLYLFDPDGNTVELKGPEEV